MKNKAMPYGPGYLPLIIQDLVAKKESHMMSIYSADFRKDRQIYIHSIRDRNGDSKKNMNTTKSITQKYKILLCKYDFRVRGQKAYCDLLCVRTYQLIHMCFLETNIYFNFKELFVRRCISNRSRKYSYFFSGPVTKRGGLRGWPLTIYYKLQGCGARQILPGSGSDLREKKHGPIPTEKNRIRTNFKDRIQIRP